MKEKDKEFKRLINNLELENDGTDIANKINKLLLDDPKSLKLYLSRALEEIQQSQDVELTRREESVLRIVKNTDNPLTASEIPELLDDQFRDIKEEFKSLQHRSHVSSILNKLVDLGLLGKMKYRNKVYYVEPEEAVREWLKNHGGVKEENISIKRISENTGLPLQSVKEVLDNMNYL